MFESELIKSLKEGDESSFKVFVKDYSRMVFNTAISILQNTEDAEDITQEVFIEIFRSIRKFKGESTLSTWVYRIAITKSLEYLRKKNRKKRFALFKSDDGEAINNIPMFHHPGIQLENKERAAILFSALNKLPENQKSAFVLHKMEELPYTEIAKVLNVSVSAVESLMFRAKQNLQKLLSAYYERNEK